MNLFPNLTCTLFVLLWPEPFPQPPRAALCLRRHLRQCPLLQQAVLRPLWKGRGGAGVMRSGPLQPALTAKPLPSPQAESPPHPSCLRKESTGLCCILFCLGWAFCGLCLGSREPARRPLTLTASPLVGHGGQRETWLCTALCTSSSHFLPSSRFCAQGIFGCLSGLLLTILFL